MTRAVKESLFLPHLARFRFPCPGTASDKRQIDPIRRDIRADFNELARSILMCGGSSPAASASQSCLRRCLRQACLNVGELGLLLRPS